MAEQVLCVGISEALLDVNLPDGSGVLKKGVSGIKK